MPQPPRPTFGTTLPTAGPALAGPPPEPPMDEFELFSLVEPEAKKHGLPVDLVMRQIRQESGGKRSVVSPKGAVGLMQLMPTTGASYGVTDATDPVQNIRAGTLHLANLLKKHKGDQRAALAEYNGGAAAVHALKFGKPWKETAGYLQGILPNGGPILPSDIVASPVNGQPVDEFEAFQQTLATPQTEGVAGPQALPGAGVVGAELGPAPPPNPQDFEPGTLQSLGTSMAAEFDPTVPSGRRNIAGGLGSAAATGALAGAVAGSPAAGVGAIPGALIGGGVAMLGAAAGGALAEGGEQLAGTKPGSGEAVAGAAGEQALYELGGQALMWPIKAVGRRVIASTVGKNALHGLTAAREATLSRLEGALTTAKDTLASTTRATGDALHSVRERATREAEAVRGHVRGAVEGVTRTASGFVDSARAAAEGVAEQAAAVRRGPYNALVGAPPPAPAAAGRQAQAVIEGPAKTARQRVGEAVEDAAKSGPIRDIRPLKQEALRILENEIRPSGTAFPKAAAGDVPASAGKGGGSARIDLEKLSPQTRAIVEAAQEEEAQKLLSHPALGVITRILQAGDEVTFAAAHGFKRELDDALLGTQDQVVKKRVTAMTQHLRGSLRKTMEGHAPYDEATARYASIIPLYTKGFAKDLRKAAVDDPEALVRRIDLKNPTKLGMLRELLTTQAAEGGDAAAGQAAWDTVRASWTHEKVIKGGIDKLGERLEKLTPEFVKEMYGDASGQQVLGNLRTIASAYQQALTDNTLGVEKAVGAAKTMSAAAIAEARKQGAAALKSTRRLGREGVRQAELDARGPMDAARAGVADARAAKTAAAKPTAQETAFLESSIGPSQTRRPTQIAADVLHTTALGPTSIYGSLAAARLIFGPKSADLVRWAAFSPTHTQLLVKALTSPAAGQAAADLLRAFSAGDAIESVVGGPPPKPMPSHRRAGPPPAP